MTEKKWFCYVMEYWGVIDYLNFHVFPPVVGGGGGGGMG